MSSILDHIDEEIAMNNFLTKQAERKNAEIKKEIEIKEGKYVDKSFFPKNDFVYGKVLYPFGHK